MNLGTADLTRQFFLGQNLALYYDDIAIRQLLVSMIVVTVGVYVYERAREQSEARTRQADTAKSEFATLASQQLRTPISAINWFAEMLLSGDAGKLSKEQAEHIQQIYDSNQRMAVLVDAMLMVSSLELGNLPLRPEPTDMAATASKIVKDQIATAPERGIRLKEQYDTTLPKISFDPHILKIILQNVTSNAIKYTPDKGSISVEITRTNEKLKPQSHGSIAIIVSDSGYGIPVEAQSKIFTKFYRANNIKSKDTDGTGLGLFIVKAVLDYIGGRISFDSHEGKGTTFIIYLPIEGIKTTKSSPS